MITDDEYQGMEVRYLVGTAKTEANFQKEEYKPSEVICSIDDLSEHSAMLEASDKKTTSFIKHAYTLRDEAATIVMSNDEYQSEEIRHLARPSKQRFDDQTEERKITASMRPVNSLEEDPVVEVPTKTRGFVFSPLKLAMVAMLAWCLLEIWVVLKTAVASSTLLGSVYGLIIGLVVFALLTAVFKEIKLLHSLKKVENQRQQIESALKEHSFSEITGICRGFELNKRGKMNAAYLLWLEANENLTSADDSLNLYSRQVLVISDQEAKDIITKYSLSAAALVVISPFALGDMLVTLLNSRAMLDKIADCYGIKLGLASRVGLYRMVLWDMVQAAATDLLADIMNQQLANHGIGYVLGKATGEGLRSGFFAARLGLKAVKVCRPVPLPKGDKEFGYMDICRNIADKFINSASPAHSGETLEQ